VFVIYLRLFELTKYTENNIHATIGAFEKMPRFWVLTDHTRRQVILILRGTMSLNEVAVVITCPLFMIRGEAGSTYGIQ